MIEKLTQEQIDKFTEYVDKYTKIGLSTEPIDFEKAKKAVEKVYKCGGLDIPKIMVYCPSPLSAVIFINLLKNLETNMYNVTNQVRDQVENQVRDQVENQVWNQVRNQVRNQVWNQVWNQVEDQVGTQVRNQVWNQVRNQFEDQVLDQVEDQVLDQVGSDMKLNYIYSSLEGQHDVGFVSLYKYLRNVLNLKDETEKATGIFDLTETSGWIYAFNDICFICDRHTKINFDENRKLHSENDYAFQYPDGFGGTFWHGTKIPEWLIFEKEKLTIEKIFEEKNKEIQRCMIDIYGRDKLLEEEGILIHSDDWGDLYHTKTIKDSFSKPLAFLKVINFSPNETAWLTKPEINEIFKIAQDEIGYENNMRQGDVIFVNKNSKEENKEKIEKKIKKFQSKITQEIELLMRRKNVKDTVTYKNYILQVNPKIQTAYEAWQSNVKRLHPKDYLPIIAS